MRKACSREPARARTFGPLLLAAALSVACATAAAAQSAVAEAGLELRGTPYLPYASEAYMEAALSPLVPAGLVRDLSVRAWYAAGTPYLVPGSFFEAGASVRWNLGGFDRALLVVGLGTAFSMAGDAVSVPLVVEMEGRYRFAPWWILNPALQALVYGEGFIASAGLRNVIRPFKFGLGVTLGADVNFAYSEAAMVRALTWGLSAGLVYAFQE